MPSRCSTSPGRPARAEARRSAAPSPRQARTPSSTSGSPWLLCLPCSRCGGHGRSTESQRRPEPRPASDPPRLLQSSAVVTADVLAFVRANLPEPPVRLLEIGAGDGELARALSESGYEVVAIDPEPGGEHVRAVALLELEEPAGSFGGAVAVTSLHHVEPLEESLEHLAELVGPGGVLVVDEFDVAAF